MGRHVDRREPPGAAEPTPERRDVLSAAASEISDSLPGAHRVVIQDFDAATGNPAVITSEGATAETGNYVERAQEHLAAISPAMGLTAADPTEFTADEAHLETTAGAVTVHFQQQYKGIPIFRAARAVRFAPDGSLRETVGVSYAISGDLDATPALGVEDAAMIAARHIAVPDDDELGATDAFGEPMTPSSVDLTGFTPTVLEPPTTPDRAVKLAAGPFGAPTAAALIWFPLSEQDLRLCWELVATMPDLQGQWRTLVDAQNGEILYSREIMNTVVAQGNTFLVDGEGGRQLTDFPLPLARYGLPIPTDLPPGFPDHWVETDSTVGNSTFARLGDSGPPLTGSVQGGTVVFDPASPREAEQQVLNIFYFNCFMHDFFYLLGFTEAAGNFQSDNFGRGGGSGDPVDARSHPGPVFGTANMLTLPDARSPTMNMGLVASTDRHTALDSSVVFHEFMHGVTQRLVGGRMNTRALEEIQSGGMGEGWGDYVACTINDDDVVGAWVVDRPGGIRGFRYDANFPDGFGDLGTGRYTAVHAIGEIWCATLLEMNRRIGKELGVALVVDALKLSPANPSFLDMRDAILVALDNKLAAGQMSGGQHAAAHTGIWGAFARFGMGVGARSNGPFLSGIVASSEVPAEPGPTEPGPTEPGPGPGPTEPVPDPDDPCGKPGLLNTLRCCWRRLFGR